MKSFISKLSIVSVALLGLLTPFTIQAAADVVDPYQCEGNGLITHQEGVTSLHTLKYFGTSVTIDLYGVDEIKANTALCRALNVIQEYHYQASNYSTYPHVTNIKTINNAPEKVHHIDEKLTELIASSLDWYSLSNGYFNIALSPVIDLWRQHRGQCKGDTKTLGLCTIPSNAALAHAAILTDINDIKLDRTLNTIQMKPGMSIDLGGIAKGWMAEKVYDSLKIDGINAFMINAGGNIRHYGLHPEQRTFATAIEDPLCKKSEYQLPQCQTFEGQFHEVVQGQDLTIVSSGNYLNYFIAGGVEYHHLIDPKTLHPKPTGISTTVVMNGQQIFADVISTSLFLMPIEEAMTFAEEHDELEAVWYLDEKGSKRKSSGFDKYHLTEDNIGQQ